MKDMRKDGMTVAQLTEKLAKVDANAKVHLNGFSSGCDLVDIKRYDVGGEDVVYLQSAAAPYNKEGKREVFYDHKLLASIAYITRNWENVGKERYLAFMQKHWCEDECKHMTRKVENYDDPITLHLHALDDENLRLTLEFFIQNESILADRFCEFCVDDGK